MHAFSTGFICSVFPFTFQKQVNMMLVYADFYGVCVHGAHISKRSRKSANRSYIQYTAKTTMAKNEHIAMQSA